MGMTRERCRLHRFFWGGTGGKMWRFGASLHPMGRAKASVLLHVCINTRICVCGSFQMLSRLIPIDRRAWREPRLL